MEVWKDVIGYEGLYQVSNTGKIFSLYKNKIMKQKLDKAGYCVIGLTKDEKQKVLKVHRLVAQAFLDDFEEKDKLKYHVDHINENKQNNHVSNLQMLTHFDNCFKRTGRNAHQIIKATNVDTGEEYIFNGQNEAARELGVNQGNIYNALAGKIKQTKGYKFERLNRKEVG